MDEREDGAKTEGMMACSGGMGGPPTRKTLGREVVF